MRLYNTAVAKTLSTPWHLQRWIRVRQNKPKPQVNDSGNDTMIRSDHLGVYEPRWHFTD